MESNGLLLGKIGGSFKTYLESFIKEISEEDIEYISNYHHKLYRNESGSVRTYKSDNKNEAEKFGKEVVILSLIPSYENKGYYIAELIDKDLLIKHLQDERMILEDLRNNNNPMSL